MHFTPKLQTHSNLGETSFARKNLRFWSRKSFARKYTLLSTLCRKFANIYLYLFGSQNCSFLLNFKGLAIVSMRKNAEGEKMIFFPY